MAQLPELLVDRFARWNIFKQKIPKLGKFWTVLQWKMLVYSMAIWFILANLVCFVAIRYILLSFGIFLAIGYILHMVIWYIFPVLVCCAKKNLATLLVNSSSESFTLIEKTEEKSPQLQWWEENRSSYNHLKECTIKECCRWSCLKSTG
jgi:hypothetical protein